MKWSARAFMAHRYLLTRRRHRGAGATILSLVGLAVGVLTLNAVLAVMNGFQLTFIESLVELSSSHLRWSPPEGHPDSSAQKLVRDKPGIQAIIPTTEGQTLITTELGGQRGAVLRGFAQDALQFDSGLARHLTLTRPSLGVPGLPAPGQVLMGAELARSLGLVPGDKVRLTALTGAGFSLLKPQLVEMVVKGTFSTGYYEIDASWILGNIDDTREHFAGPNDFFYAIKLEDGMDDQVALGHLATWLHRPAAEFSSWRQYNTAFFGALRTEKAVMMVLVGLIFFVVGVNIYFSQKRAVMEHREDLALWAAVGVHPGSLRSIFALEGLAVGVLAALVGTVTGLLVAWSFGSLDLLSSDAFYLPALPARVLPHEVVLIALACIASSTLAAWTASKSVTRIPVAEVLKSE